MNHNGLTTTPRHKRTITADSSTNQSPLRPTISSLGKAAAAAGQSTAKKTIGRVSKKGSKSPRKNDDTNQIIGLAKQRTVQEQDIILEQVGEEDGSMIERSKISNEMTTKEVGEETTPSQLQKDQSTAAAPISGQRKAKLPSQRHSISTVKAMGRPSTVKSNQAAGHQQSLSPNKRTLTDTRKMSRLYKQIGGPSHSRKLTSSGAAAAKVSAGSNAVHERTSTLFSDIESDNGIQTDRAGLGRRPRTSMVAHNFVPDSQSETKRKQSGQQLGSPQLKDPQKQESSSTVDQSMESSGHQVNFVTPQVKEESVKKVQIKKNDISVKTQGQSPRASQFRKIQKNTAVPQEPITQPKIDQNIERFSNRLSNSSSRKDGSSSPESFQRTTQAILNMSTQYNTENIKSADLIIENERLKTTVMVLTQKLNDRLDSEAELLSLRKKNRELTERYDNSNTYAQQARAEAVLKEGKIEVLEQELEELKRRLQESEEDRLDIAKAKDGFKKDSNQMSLKIMELEQEIFQSKSVGMELIEQIKNCEQELQSMTEYCKKLEKQLQNGKQEIAKLNEQLEKNQVIYIAKKHDKIDEGLAEYLNQFPEREKLKILFLRESEGVYQFGQRRVYVKIEKGNQIKVKVGGGFVDVKDFIEQFTASEVEKIERKDVRNRFESKLMLQKISTYKSLNQSETYSIMSSQRPRSERKSDHLSSPRSARASSRIDSPMKVIRFKDMNLSPVRTRQSSISNSISQQF